MWEMIKAEFRHIRRNRLLLLSFIVICFIPFLYSIFFLKSVWDPYGSTQNLPVAVVNEDHAVKYQGQTLKVGAQLVQELRKNKQLKWEIVSKQTAKEGLAHRKYYTVVTIPKDFSKNAATVLNQSPKKMELKYETNGSLNYIGQVISEMAMTKLNQKIRAQVTQAYATTMIKLVKQVGTGFNQAASGAKQISTGMVTLNSGTNQFVAGVSTVNNGVQTLQAAVTPLASGASQLASGSTTLASGVNQYTSGVGLLAAGLTKLSANSAALNAGMATLASGVNQYTSGVDQLGSGLTTLKKKSASLNQGASQLNATVNSSLGSLDFTGIMSAMNQASQMKSSLASLQSGLTQAQSALSAVSTEANQLKTASSALSGVSSAASSLSGVTQNDAAIAQSAAALAKSTTDATTKAQLDTIAQKAQSNVTTIQGLGTALSQVNSLSTSLSGLQSQLNNLDLASLQTTLSGAQTTLNQANQLLTTLQGYQGALSTMPSKLAALKQATSSLASGINQYTAGVDTAASGASQLSANSASLTSGANQLQSGVSQYTAGVNQANAGTGQLTANSAALVSGANQLATALIQLNAKVPSLVSGVSALASGTQKLVDNSPALVAGTAKLNAGAGELADKLISGAEKVNAVQPSKKAAKMFAAPTTVKHTNYSYVPNYGHALAPYVLSVALYVGALIFNFVYPIRRVALLGRKASAWWASKLAVGMTSITVMALAEGGIMMLLGLQVLHVPSFFWTLILFGWASMAVVMFLSMTFDNPGRFVAMVLLMLQLGGSGGTFPMQVTMKFYNVIHWYLPMTYSILGLRNGISGGLGEHYVAFCNSVLLAITIVFVILLLVSMIYLQRHHYAGKSELDNNQELLGPEADDDGMHLKDRHQSV